MTFVGWVFTTEAELVRAAGTDVHLSRVEAWNDRVVVQMAGRMNDAIRADRAAYGARRSEWNERHPVGSDWWPPKLPGDLIFQETQVWLTD